MARCHRDPCTVCSHYNSPVLAAAAFFAVVIYVAVTFEVTKWRQKHRRSTNKHDSAYHDIATDSLLNFETVKAFANEEHEVGRFRDAVRARCAPIDVPLPAVVASRRHMAAAHLLWRAAATWQVRKYQKHSTLVSAGLSVLNVLQQFDVQMTTLITLCAFASVRPI